MSIDIEKTLFFKLQILNFPFLVDKRDFRHENGVRL